MARIWSFYPDAKRATIKEFSTQGQKKLTVEEIERLLRQDENLNV